eukprot:5945426-Pyramimonas_sp.AAC.1
MEPRSRGLPLKQLTPPAAGGDGRDSDATERREFQRPKAQTLALNARAPSRGAPRAAGDDFHA